MASLKVTDLKQKFALADALGHGKGMADSRPSSDRFPCILRHTNGSTRFFFGMPIKRHSVEEWDFNSEYFWTKAGVTNLSYWEVEKVDGEWNGYFFKPKKVDMFHYSDEFNKSSMWACKKWKVEPKQLALPIVETLELLSRRVQLPRKITIETSGNKIFDIHSGHNDAYSDLLIGNQTFDIHVSWSFDKQEQGSDWYDLDIPNALSVRPVQIKFEGL